MATRSRYVFGRNNKLMDVTGTDDTYNTIMVMDTRPVVEGSTIDRSLMGPDSANPQGQFRGYEAMDPRPIGSMPGGERSVVTRAGAGIMEAADRRLMGDYGGVRVNDGQFAGTDAQGRRSVMTAMPEGFAPIMTNDNRLALSPEAAGALGQRQIMEDQAASRGPVSVQQMGQRLSVRKQLQAQADQGVAPGTDALNREQMRGTMRDANVDWLERNRPKDLMKRINTQNQIMTQTEASLMTPQVMTQDGVMAGWDPIRKKIVSDASGAEAIAQGRIQEAQIQASGRGKDQSVQGMSDDDLNNRLVQLRARQIGELDDIEKLRVESLMKQGKPQEAAALKDQLQKSKWSPEMQPYFDQYQSEWNRRNGVKPGAAAAQGKKSLGGIQAR